MPDIPDADIKCHELARFAASKGLVEAPSGREPSSRGLFSAIEGQGGPKLKTLQDTMSNKKFSQDNSHAILAFAGLAENFPPWFEPLEGESREPKALFFRKALSPHRRMPRLASVSIDEAKQSSNELRIIHAELTFNQMTPPGPDEGEGQSEPPLKGLALCLSEAALAIRFSNAGMRARRGTRLETRPGEASPLSSALVSLETAMSAERPVWIVKAPKGERLRGTIFTMEKPLLELEDAPVGSKVTAYLNICGKECSLEPVEPNPAVDLEALDVVRRRLLCVLESKAILEDDESFTQIVHDHTIEMRDNSEKRNT